MLRIEVTSNIFNALYPNEFEIQQSNDHDVVVHRVVNDSLTLIVTFN